ncbi:hypothetical protein ACJ73_02230 [Blastomyces percursus]|uniref:Lactamase-like protein nscB n=1 Tax=Blastomyces percursus TaxID=1658174 RepID=A0A1J9RCW3_9EURO|nr:hypothetical protein ACJ73_02230 [Blastomyces percursus]
MAMQLPRLPNVERLSDKIIRILGTNTYLIGQGHERLLIDAGEGRAIWSENLKATLESEKATIKAALLTHWQPDHIRGVPALVKVCPGVKIHTNQPDLDGQLNIEDGQVFKVEGATLRTYSTPGHTNDHMVFMLAEEDALFTGDNVLGHGTSVFEDLEVYLSSLEKMQYVFSGRAYPGHGAVIEDGNSKISEYIQHRQQREDEVLQVLTYGSLRSESDRPPSPVKSERLRRWTRMEMVKVIYHDLPVNLHVPASHGVLQVLKKLDGEAKVVRGGESDGPGERFKIVL